MTREEAIENLKKARCVPHKKKTLSMAIGALERKQGEWIYKPMKGQFCSVCGSQSVWKFNYCPNCGAEMRGEGDD